MKVLKRAVPGVVDVHIYGGALLLSWGLGMVAVWAAPTAFGLILLGLGLKRG